MVLHTSTTHDRVQAPASRSWLLAALAGLVSAFFGLAAAELVAGLGASLRSPVLDVGDRVIDRVPVWLKDIAIQLFGTNDKIALLVGIGLALAIYAAVVGVLAARRGRLAGDLGIAAFAGIGAVAALGSRASVSLLVAVPSLIGGVSALLALRFLIGRLGPLIPEAVSEAVSHAQPPAPPHPSHRRRFLAGAGGTILAAGALAATGRKLQARFDASVVRNGLTLPEADRPLPMPGREVQSPAAADFFTPNADFYRIDTALTVPQVDIEKWKLEVSGLVDQQLQISYQDLIDRPLVEADITLTCVSNTVGGYLVGNARWLGIRLDDLLAEAGINPDADQIVGRSVDGYTSGFPTDALDGRDALVAIGMNGELLPLEHGYPARLIVPGIYGYASATKWLSEIELTTFDAFDHYWVPRGYSAKAPIKIQSRIDTPRGLDQIAAGPFVIGGVAWAQTIGISAVEVRIDEAQWQPTDLADELTNATWRQWSLPWEATPGRHTIEVRAIDKEKAIQTPDRSEPLPNGATGHHKVVVLVQDA